MTDIPENLQKALKEIQTLIGPGGSIKKVSAGGVKIAPGIGIQVFDEGTLKYHIAPDGNLLIGADVEEPETTGLAIFSNDQDYNGEDMVEGDILIGDNSTDEPNVKWDATLGQLQFRSGKIVLFRFGIDTMFGTTTHGDMIYRHIEDATNYAATGTATAIDVWSGEPTAVATNINDGDNSTYWHSNTRRDANPWFKIDLGSELKVRHFVMSQDQNQWSAVQYKIQGSHNDADWTDIVTITPASSDEDYDFASPQTYRYFKVICTSGDGGSGWKVYNFELWSTEEDIDGLVRVPAATSDTQVLGNASAIPGWISAISIGSLIVNDAGADLDGRIEGDTDANLISWDAGLDAVGIGGVAESGFKLKVTGNLKVTGDTLSTGDTYWEGDGTGHPYGSFSSADTDIAWTQATAVQNTWYDISDADFVDGQLNLATHDGSGLLTVTKAGRYLINYSIAAESSAANTHLETAISVSGTENAQGIGHLQAVTADAEYQMHGTAILDLAASATINLSIRTTDAGTPNLKVDMADLTLIMVGGT